VINLTKIYPEKSSQKILMNVFSMLTKGDGEIFVAVRNMLIEQNFKLVKVQDFLPELTLSSGSYGTIPRDKQFLDEIEGGLNIFLKYAKLDIGSQAELFFLFMEALSHWSGDPDTDPLISYMGGN